MNISDIDPSSNFKLELSVTLALCDIVGSPFALSTKMLIENGEFDQLIALPFSPLNYNNHRDFCDDYLIHSVLKKSPNLPLQVDRTQNAMDAFWQSERDCAAVNRKLYDTSNFIPYLYEVKKEVNRILGPLTPFDLGFVESKLRFGPGASAFTKAQGAVLSDKYDREIYLTERMYPFYKSLLGSVWWDSRSDPIIVKGNEFTTVPKSAKTDRGICKEPALNSFLQLGIGALLRQRLKRSGIDLSKQEINQKFAQRAYKHGFATIDLSRASDSLSHGLVHEVLGRDWFQLVDLPRADSTFIDGNWVSLEKFSSMGNGYTFELESVIFLAICRSRVPHELHHDVSVYGDDLIVPTMYANDVVDTLNSLGFSVNYEKSYLAGNFFESCGADFFQGQPVRPFYLRGGRDGIPYTMQIANALRSYSRRINHTFSCDDRFRELWVQLYKLSPQAYRKALVDESFGDTGFIVSEMEHNCPPARFGHEGIMVRHIDLVPKRIRKRTLGRYLLALAHAGPLDNATLGFEPRRGLFGNPKTRSSILPKWTNGYCWGKRL